MKKKPLTMRTFTCSFQTLAVLFEGCKTAIMVDVEKAVRVFNNPKYDNDTVFYLFTNPGEVLELVESGVPLKKINIGGMSFKNGKTQITKAVSVNEEDVAAFRKLKALGVELDLRVVISDPPVDFEKKLSEHFN